MRTVTPHLVCAGAARAMDFCRDAFGAVEVSRLIGPDGRLWHGCMRIGDSCVMFVDESPEHGSFGPKVLKGSSVAIHLYVEDVDTFVERAKQAGAAVRMPPENMFWGDRYGILEDPFGHCWSVATHVRDMTPEEIKLAARNHARCG